jgi:hypothetical protein
VAYAQAPLDVATTTSPPQNNRNALTLPINRPLTGAKASRVAAKAPARAEAAVTPTSKVRTKTDKAGVMIPYPTATTNDTPTSRRMACGSRWRSARRCRKAVTRQVQSSRCPDPSRGDDGHGQESARRD